MEAKLVDALPVEVGWQYEPKWDGFRAIASRAGDATELMSKSGKSLARYFPEILAALRSTGRRLSWLTALILPVGDILSFDALQARLHPAASRIAELSKETLAQLLLSIASRYAAGTKPAITPIRSYHGHSQVFVRCLDIITPRHADLWKVKHRVERPDQCLSSRFNAKPFG